MGFDGTDDVQGLEVAREGAEHVMANEHCHVNCENCHPISESVLAEQAAQYLTYLQESSS